MLALAALLLNVARAAEEPADPLDSVQWPTMRRMFFPQAPLRFDERVRVSVPKAAEDPLRVPVTVRYDALTEVREVLVFIDFNPIPPVLRLRPHNLKPHLGFHVRVQQATPIRAAVRTADGLWHVGGAWVDAPGGGCTMPPNQSSRLADELIGQVRGRHWPLAEGGNRLKFQILHPNDTGLVAGVPPFFVESLKVEDAAGQMLAEMELFPPLSESPLLTLESAAAGPYKVSGRDSSGTRIEKVLP